MLNSTLTRVKYFDTAQPAVGMLLFFVVLIVTVRLVRIVKMHQ